jgi:NAD-dependent SIR2 family protein deacetylase
LYRATAPHEGFALLKKWADHMPAGFFVFTSNVDGHFQRAGFGEECVIECHGSLEFNQCVAFCRNDVWAATAESVEIDEATFRARPPLPRCPRCGGLARPNVLLFGDCEWLADRAEAQAIRYQQWRREVRGRKLAVIELGAGLAVPTVRIECEAAGGTLIRINPREPEVADGGISLPLGALAALPKIDELI